MKSNFKPLGIAAAVAVASAGYAGVASAQPSVANSALGDLALVPYYTVNGEWLTGIHIVNTSNRTQVVKFRFRRATDSMDALDFNIVMSPQDVYAGYLSDEGDEISWQADDTTCTVPAVKDGKLTMPDIYREDAETGYVEIIAMGTPTAETSPIAVAAKHTAGTPLDCVAVNSNFFADGDASEETATKGVVDNKTTYQVSASDKKSLTGKVDYEDSGNVLKVSYFIRDNDSGVEFGDNAVHIQDFLIKEASITNQQYGVFSGDLDGFDFPDLNGGVPTAGDPERGVFKDLRGGDVLGVSKLINEWTANTANGAALDWVVTMPGQYTMLDLPTYISALDDDGAAVINEDCGRGDVTEACDFRDIPVTATIRPYNREELTTTEEEGGLTVSPAPPGEVESLTLPNETNVITFGRADEQGVLGVIGDVDISADLEQSYGWLSLEVASATKGDKAVCDWDTEGDVENTGYSAAAGAELETNCSSVGGNVPMIGFAAWARQVAANPDASYGRIVAHSFESASATS